MSSAEWAGTPGCILVGLLLVISNAALADTAPHMVRDINQVPVPESSNPQYLGPRNGRVLFGATDREGSGLWATDGTWGGTRLLSRIDVFAQRQFPGSPMFIVQDGRGYFAGDDASTGVLELWATDGTGNGTVRLTSHAPSATSYSGFLDFIGVLNGRVIFYATDANDVMQVWSSDGTPAGTVQLSQLQQTLNPGGGGARAPSLMLSDRFYFVSADAFFGVQLWVSDGSVQGTQAVQSSGLQPFYSVQSLAAAGNRPMFAANQLLWAIDPATESVAAVAPSGAQPGYLNQVPADQLVSIGGVTISLGNNLPYATELWRSDGTPAGTFHLADVDSGFNPQPLPADFLLAVHGHALTLARDVSGNLQLLSTDGTVPGTVPLLGLPPPPDNVTPVAIPFQTIAGLLYFAVANDASALSWSIWRTDGTLAGTRRTSLPNTPYGEIGLTQLTPVGSGVFVEPGSADPSRPLLLYDPATDSTHTVANALAVPYFGSAVAAGGQLYFSVDDPKIGNEPWVSNGTPAGTHLIRDINPEWSDYPSDPDQFVDFDGKLAFVADDGVHGRELWISDGTSHGTHLLADVNPGPAASNPTELTARGRDLFFFATDSGGVQRLMRLHAGKTHPDVLATLSAPPSAQPPYFFPPPPCLRNVMLPLGHRLYFAASDAVSGVELWRTDGTADGTRQVADIYPGPASSNPCELTALNGRLYFAAQSASGTELWRSDGTAAGTLQVADLAPGPLSSFPSDLTAWHGELYFDLLDGNHGAQIWRSHGTASTTSLFVDLAPGNLNAYAAPVSTLPHYLVLGSSVPDASGFNFTNSLWSSDGSPGRAVVLSSAWAAGPLTLGSKALFFASEIQGVEPWITDGTPAGTRRVADISPDAGTFIDWLISFGPGAAFTTHEFATPGLDVLWRTDGTHAGTVRVGSIPTPTPSNDPFATTPRLAIGSNLFFVASTLRTGNELWVYTHCFPASGQPSSATCSPPH